MNVQFVTNEAGKKTGVLLQMSEYEKLIEDVKDLAVAAERRDDEKVSHEDFLNELREDGILQD